MGMALLVLLFAVAAAVFAILVVRVWRRDYRASGRAPRVPLRTMS